MGCAGSPGAPHAHYGLLSEARGREPTDAASGTTLYHGSPSRGEEPLPSAPPRVRPGGSSRPLPLAGVLGWHGPRGHGMDGLREPRLTPDPAAVAADVDDLAAVGEPVRERGSPRPAVQELTPRLEPPFGGQHRRGGPVPDVDELVGGLLRSVRDDREAAGPADHRRSGSGPCPEAPLEPSFDAGFLQRVDEVAQGPDADP